MIKLLAAVVLVVAAFGFLSASEPVEEAEAFPVCSPYSQSQSSYTWAFWGFDNCRDSSYCESGWSAWSYWLYYYGPEGEPSFYGSYNGSQVQSFYGDTPYWDVNDGHLAWFWDPCWYNGY